MNPEDRATHDTSRAHWAGRWPHFAPYELACHHCGAIAMDLDFLDHLQGMRRMIDRPMVVTSGYRCAEHNRAVSTSGDHGPHVRGVAVDIAASGHDVAFLIALGRHHHITAFGLKLHGPPAGRFIHLEMRPAGAPGAVWTYP